MYEWHGYGGGMMWIFWILIIIGLIWIVGFATRREGNPSAKLQSARGILEERYARGEIEHDEFEQKKKALGD